MYSKTDQKESSGMQIGLITLENLDTIVNLGFDNVDVFLYRYNNATELQVDTSYPIRKIQCLENQKL